MFKIIGVKLDFFADVDMYQKFIKKGMRGEVSYVKKGYSKANNKYMKAYNKDKGSKYIKYKDVNCLYGWTMSEYCYLSLGKFK